MAKLDFEQLRELARNAGFLDGPLNPPANAAMTMAAIALAESGGNPNAVANEPNGTKSYGLWQINSIHSDILGGGDWKVPKDNAAMAYKVFAQAGGSYDPWSTYKSGAWEDYLPDTSPLFPGGGPNPLGGLSDLAHVLTNVGNLIAKIFNPDLWKRIGLGLLGAILAIAGFIVMVGGNATDVIPAGKVLKGLT